jgi:tetratricopeptide (TPR) repeat protein
MASIITGYQYDIFISYRQKDNKYDGWVTEFVENLKRELEATFKEEISVYFDINPHDGLLETHDVADSLKDKLKCLVFIPIISRTYCDPKSFAWEHEFKAFIEQAAHDQFGMKIKLPNGNVASRVLPIRIHELDRKDLMLCESALGTYLRGVEFIYKEPGVNKPLKSDDDEKKNLNNTKYRIQINKVANAVQEIISGLIAQEIVPETEKPQQETLLEKPIYSEKWEKNLQPAKSRLQKILSGFFISAILVLAGLFLYPKIFKQDRKEIFSAKGEITVAVMPFQNLTNDATRNFWEVMIQDNLITSLSNARELKIRQTESVLSLLDNADMTNYASLTPALARSISQKLDANVFVHGSINQVGNVSRLNARLIDAKTEEVFKSFQIEGPPENILLLSDSLSRIIAGYLIVELLKKDFYPDLWKGETSNSPEAVRFLIEGLKYFRERNYPKAIESFYRSIEIDPDFIEPKLWLPSAFGNQGNYEEAKRWTKIVNENKDQFSRNERLRAEYLYAAYFGTHKDAISKLRQRLEVDDKSPIVYYLIGLNHNNLNEYEKAIPEFERALNIYRNWGVRPSWVFNYTALGDACHKTGQFRKEEKLYKQAEKDFPDDPLIIRRQAILALARGKTKKADEYLLKYESISRNEGASEALIQTRMGWIYEEAEKIDRAEEHLRNALELEPQNPWRMRDLANLLIEKELNINEGMILIENALVLRPDNHTLLHAKGLGLYKQGNYREALEILQQSWDLRMEHASYNHEAFLHLEEAKKAVTSMR